mmetsp:Transcript_20717/g.46115  ORF Transcript_20717/g.46115 Transcript_20717/m.46115 type:complete len:208 (-) Transcript_20717:110-733(-)
MARMATSVLPKPTSPHTRRSMGRVLLTMSAATCRKHVAWSSVGVYPNRRSKAAYSWSSGTQGVRCRALRTAMRLMRFIAVRLLFACTVFFFRFHFRRSRIEPSSCSPDSAVRNTHSSRCTNFSNHVTSPSRYCTTTEGTKVCFSCAGEMFTCRMPRYLPTPYSSLTTKSPGTTYLSPATIILAICISVSKAGTLATAIGSAFAPLVA